MSRRIESVLERLEPEAPGDVARGRLALGNALVWTSNTAWPEIACSFSDLADGLPLELVWRPGRPGLYWTAEPAAPEWSPGRRLARAVSLVERAGKRFDKEERSLISGVVRAAPWPWPVWVGGRHARSRDAAKLYLRLSPAALRVASGRLAAALPALRGDDHPMMLGIEPAGGTELYWRRAEREPGDLYRLARIAGLSEAVARLDAALLDWTGAGLDAPGHRATGLSLKLGRSGAPEAIAAFLRTRPLGAPENLRARILATGGDVNPAMAALWGDGILQPMLLTIAATDDALSLSLGFTLASGAA